MKELNSNKKEKLDELDKLLSSLEARDRLEVVGNYFIRLGIRIINPTVLPTGLRELWKVILDERQKNGETLGSALAHQGLFILLWLEEEEE